MCIRDSSWARRVSSPRGRASSTSGATRPYRNRASFSALVSMRGRYTGLRAWRDANALCGPSGGWKSRPERGGTPVRNEKARPAQQVGTQAGKQEAVRRGPANGLAHVQGPGHEVGSSHRDSQRCQGRAQPSGLPLKTADPELAALVRHARLRGRLGSSLQSAAVEQTGDEKQRDHEDTETKIGQSKFRQQRNGGLAAEAQVTANADGAGERHIRDGAAVEAVSGQGMMGGALRTVVGPITIGVGDLFGVLLNGAGERV